MKRWQRIESLFEQALTLVPSERDSFLREVCAGDVELFEELSSLISNDLGTAHDDWAAVAAAELIGSTGSETAFHDSNVTLSGSTVGPYAMGDLIGVGAMGRVYRARDSRIGRDVAIKVLPREMRNRDSEVRRFQREARALGSLNHPNIAAIYDVIERSGAAYLVLELVEGVDLATRLHDGALTINEVLDIAAQIAHALEAAHAAKIVHRDLKPPTSSSHRADASRCSTSASRERWRARTSTVLIRPCQPPLAI
jgi:serine/threonine protein kinase